MKIDCFKAYDIRGRLPDQLNEEIAHRIGRAFAEFLQPKRVIVGHDVRLSSQSLVDSLSAGLCEAGCNVLDIGLCGTEEVYHATFSQRADGGIMVTASHNPIDYNGMKLVRDSSRPISGDTGLDRIRQLAQSDSLQPAAVPGMVAALDCKKEYIEHLLSYVDPKVLRPLKVVVNAGNGCAGPVIDLLESRLPLQFVKICHDPDGTFPSGIPNPLLPENRSLTRDAVLRHRADLGIAWDGDFDRCFLFDEQGNFIEGYYIVGLLSSMLLQKYPGSRIIHDPRLTWNTIDVVREAKGEPIMSKTGHAFIKERMRLEDAIYGGEMSAHHYFRDFAYCDSGMIPWLLVTQLLSLSGKTLSALVEERIRKFPASGEINRTVDDPQLVISGIEEKYRSEAVSVDHTDGLSLEFSEWRFNLRMSNTEPVIRLNVESRADVSLMEEKTTELLEEIGGNP